MKIACRLAFTLFILVVQLVVITCPAMPAAIAPDDAKQIMRVSQIKRGMRGYGLTVFQGTKIEKFDVEVLGILPKMNGGRDLIMVRIGGGPITARGTGILAGMSGSPCYISGKLIGAVAYGSSFTKEPVGMVTPIEDMLEAWDANLPASPSGYSSPQSLPNPVSIGGEQVRRIEIGRPGDTSQSFENGTLRMTPLMTPLMVTGMSARGIGRIADALRPWGIEPMAGPGSPSSSNVKAQLVPGAAVGIALARGDIDMSGVGTLTYRRGKKVLGFGHPMLGIGAIDAPMTTAYVTDLMSKLSISTKMAAPLETVGRIFQDRPWSVAGAVGSMPKMIPAVVRIDDEAYKRSRTFKVSVINHPLLASQILTAVVSEALFQVHPSPGDATAEVSYEVVADQIGKITRKNVFYDPIEIDSASITDIGAILGLLSANRFHRLDIRSVNVTVRIEAIRNTATVDRVFLKKSEFEPGETVDVGVVLRPYRKDRITRTFSIKIPATAPDGRMTLQVRGGASPAATMIAVQAGDGSEPETSSSGMATADNVKQLIDKYLEREKNNELVVRLIMRSTAVNVAGEKLTGLPNAISDIMKSSRNSGLKIERDEAKEVYDAGTIVYGSAQVSIDVKRKDVKETKSTSKATTAPSSPSGDESVSSTSSAAVDDLPDDDMGSYVSLAAVEVTEETTEEDETSDSSETKSEDTAAADKPVSKKDEPETASAKPSESKKDVKTIVRQPKIWTQSSQADFSKGEFSGVSASSENKLEMVPTVRKLAETPEQFVWTLAPTADGVYAGTGNSGRIYHITRAGEIKVFFETGELEVHALVVDKDGNLYAGTSPNGKVFKIGPDGKGRELWKADERYVLALATDGQDNLYAGVGDAGKVYKIAPDGHARVFAEISEQQVLSLHWTAEGSLLVGTGINGIVFRVDSGGRALPIFDAGEEAITSIVADKSGNVYAGTSTKGVVYKIAPDNTSKPVLTKASRVLALAQDGNDNIYAISDGNVVKITPEEVTIALDSAKDKVQFLALAYDKKTETLYAGTGNIGSVYASSFEKPNAQPVYAGTFESAVHDAQMISKWGKLKWTAETPEGTSVEIRTRTGNVPTPDNTWSAWSHPYVNKFGDQIAGGEARYFQYQVTLQTTRPDVSAKVSSVSASYLTPNQAPKVTITSPKGGVAWAGKKTITWTASDPDKDTLTYDGYYSTDGGNEWKSLFGDIRGDNGGAGQKTKDEITAKIVSELEKSKDIPDEMKQKILKPDPKPTASTTKDSEQESAGNSASSSKTSHEFSTVKLPDGVCLIKIVASDKSSNGHGAQTDEAVSESFIVCNKPPNLTVFKSGVKTGKSGQTTLTGSVSGTAADIVGVQYRIDAGAWVSAAADDGVFDSPSEAFTVVTDEMASGSHKIEVQAVDAAGNASSETVEIKVE